MPLLDPPLLDDDPPELDLPLPEDPDERELPELPELRTFPPEDREGDGLLVLTLPPLLLFPELRGIKLVDR